MELVFSIIVLLVFSYLLVYLAKKIRFPEVVALIIVGLIVALPSINELLIGQNVVFFSYLGDIGLFALMFLAGLEISWKELYKEKKDSFVLASIVSVVSFLFGFFAMYFFGFSLIVAIVVGIAMSITAEATRAKVLLDLKVLKTRVGSVLMGAGIVDDLFGLGLFAILMYFADSTAFYHNILIVGTIFFFFLGIFSRKFIGEGDRIIGFEKSLMWFVVPFFFVSIGLSFDFKLLLLSPLLLAGIVFVGFIGKFAGAFVSKPFIKFDIKQLYLISWAMNSRGAIELVLALIAFKAALVSQEVYSSLVVLALTTTLIFPFVITKMIKRDKKIMN